MVTVWRMSAILWVHLLARSLGQDVFAAVGWGIVAVLGVQILHLRRVRRRGW